MPEGPSRGSEDIIALTGASLVSAVGSLVMHLAPFLAVAMIAAGYTSVAGAGWVRSVSQFGELAIALVLPLIGIAEFGRKAVLILAVTFVLGLALAGVSYQPVFWLGWIVIGAGSGALKYLGILAAARTSQPTLAFSLRLSIVLMLAGLASAVLASSAALLTYDSMLLFLGITVVAVLLLGMLMMRPAQAERAPASKAAAPAAATKSLLASVSGLVTIYLFFTGISGVLVFVLHQAAEQQMTITSAAWAIAATKFGVGAWLIAAASYSALKGKADRLWLQGAILTAAIVGISISRNWIELLCGLPFEIAANSLSVRIQGAVVKGAPTFVSRYLNFAILAGVATGPAVNGFAVSIGHSSIYLVLGAVAAFAPALWNWRFGEPERARMSHRYFAVRPEGISTELVRLRLVPA